MLSLNRALQKLENNKYFGIEDFLDEINSPSKEFDKEVVDTAYRLIKQRPDKYPKSILILRKFIDNDYEI